MPTRRALLIGSSRYEDAGLSRLLTPAADVEGLAAVLRNPEIGAFEEVTTLLDGSEQMVRRAVARLFAGRSQNDLLLLYFSGHGILDDQGHLHLATRDTDRHLLSATALSAAFVRSEMDRSRSHRKVLILDCCHSAAFARGAKGTPGASVGTGAAFEGTGYGKVVLAATDATQYAWEGDEPVGEGQRSVFTRCLIEGLETGQADRDGSGWVSVDDLYDYVHEKVVSATPRQTPVKHTFRQTGELIIARNPRCVPNPVLSTTLQLLIENPIAESRCRAVQSLERRLSGRDKDLARAAQAALKHLSEQDDSLRVRGAAAAALAAHPLAQRGIALATPTDTRNEVEGLQAQRRMAGGE